VKMSVYLEFSSANFSILEFGIKITFLSWIRGRLLYFFV